MTATATTTTMLVDKPRASTQYVRQDGRVWFTRMCGVTTTDLTDAGSQPRTLGVALIQADGRRYEGADLVLESIDEAPAALTCRWRIGASGLRLTTTWQADDGRARPCVCPNPTTVGARPCVCPNPTTVGTHPRVCPIPMPQLELSAGATQLRTPRHLP